MYIIGSGNSNRAFVGKFKHDSYGFTLIELMVVVMIIGILAAIAIPSYRRYAVLNAERETQAKMLQLQIQLERWRASALTYKGFKPQRVNGSTISYAYDEDDKTTIYVPSGSTVSNYRYKITLVDDTESSLAPAPSNTVDSSVGRIWIMLAEPNSTGVTKNAHILLMTSTGIRCKGSAVGTDPNDPCEGQESW